MQDTAPHTQPAAGAGSPPLTLHVTPHVDRATIYQNKSLQRRCAPLSFSAPVSEVQVMVPMPMKAHGRCGYDRDSLQVEFGAAFDGKVILAGVLVDEVEQHCLRNDGTVDVKVAHTADVASASDSDADGGGVGDVSSAKARCEVESQLRTVKQKLLLNEIAQAEAASVLDYSVDLAKCAVEPCKGAPLMHAAALHDPEMWGAHLDALESARREHAKTKRELLRAKATLEAEKWQLERKLDLGDGVPSRGSGHSEEAGTTVDVAVLTLKVLKAVPPGPEAVVYVSYIVPSGRWSAVYEAHLNTVTDEVVLYYNAEVVLNSGDDLKDVVLTLSSAVPRRNAVLPPTMAIWRCGIVRPLPPAPQPMMGANTVRACRVKLLCDDAPEDAPAPHAAPMMMRVAAKVEQPGTGAILNFVIPNPQTVMANGKTTRLPLTELHMPAEISYVSIPEKSLAAFTHAKIKNTSDFLLLPGEIAVFLDGNYVSGSRLDKQCAPGGMLDMYFGADPSVEVKRVLLRQTNKKVQNSYFKGTKSNVKTFTYKITIRNKKRATGSADGAVCIKLVEHIPISNEEQLQVRLVSPLRPHDDIYIYDDEEDRVRQQLRKSRLLDNEGIVEIERRVRAGESVEVVFAFEVEAPSDSTVYGL